MRRDYLAPCAVWVLFIVLLQGISYAQDADTQRNNWLLGVIFKLNKMKDTAIEDIRKYDGEIQKCESIINESEDIVRLARTCKDFFDNEKYFLVSPLFPQSAKEEYK